MDYTRHLHLKWNWQLSSSPEELWLYVADTNRLFKNLHLPDVQSTGMLPEFKRNHPQLSYNSIKYSDAWIEEPFEWEYPYRYGVRRTYKNGPYREIKIQVDLFPNKKGTRLQYQLLAVPRHNITAALSTFKHKTLQRSRLKDVFRYYDELIKKNHLPYEVVFKRSLLPRIMQRLGSAWQSLTAGLVATKSRVIRYFCQLVQCTRLREAAERCGQLYHGFRHWGGIRLNRALEYVESRRRLYLPRLRHRLSCIGRTLAAGLQVMTAHVRELTVRVKESTLRLLDRIGQSAPYNHLCRAADRCIEVTVTYWYSYQIWLINIFVEVRKKLTADLKDRTDRLMNFTQLSIARCVGAAEIRYRHYRVRFKKSLSYVGSQGRLYETHIRRSLLPRATKRLNGVRQSLIEATGLEEIVDRLTDFIHRADDIDLIRIKPYQLADYWQLERKDVLLVFLHAAKKGLLDFNWDLYCPTCRTVQHTCNTLGEVHEPVFCSECSSHFTVNFNESIQLSFRPNPLIRKVYDGKYCSASPCDKPHVAIQQYLKTGQKRYVKTRLDKGIYRLRAADAKGCATVVVNDDGQDTVNIRLSSNGLNGEQVVICRDPNLIFENKTQQDQTFILEKASWPDTGVTAAQVTSLQVFRDLFEQEVLRKGEKIAVDRLTLMFTDLFESTAMYHKEGDNQAVGRVIEHFEILQQAVARENGALVKTIGDSIMAVFSKPDQAFRAFITAQKKISENTKSGKSLKLKAGIHHGNCVAVNLNNRIDYFGSTVNIASRLVDLANENEIIISESVSGNKEIHQLLTDNTPHYTVVQEAASLKGFDREMFNIERIRLEKSLLRLAI